MEYAVGVIGAAIFFVIFGGPKELIEAWHDGKNKGKQLELDIERERTKQAELGRDKQSS